MLKLDSEKGKQYLSGKYTHAVVDGDKVTIDGQYSFNGESGRKVAELISELSSAKALPPVINIDIPEIKVPKVEMPEIVVNEKEVTVNVDMSEVVAVLKEIAGKINEKPTKNWFQKLFRL